MKFIRSIVANDYTPAADGTYTFDLPVNPLSYIDFTIKCLNVTNEATIAEILALVTNIEVLHRGSALVSISAADLLAMGAVINRTKPYADNLVADDNGTRYIMLRIPFARWPLDPEEGVPATHRGELQLRTLVDIANAGADGLILQIEAAEMVGASPATFLKYRTLTQTPVVGNNDLAIPSGNDLVGILLYGTTVPATTAWTKTINEARILLDNMEEGYASANWESMHGDLSLRVGNEKGYVAASGDDDLVHYAFMDCDPSNNSQFLITLNPGSLCILRYDAGDTNAMRAIPLELSKAASITA